MKKQNTNHILHSRKVPLRFYVTVGAVLLFIAMITKCNMDSMRSQRDKKQDARAVAKIPSDKKKEIERNIVSELHYLSHEMLANKLDSTVAAVNAVAGLCHKHGLYTKRNKFLGTSERLPTPEQIFMAEILDAYRSKTFGAEPDVGTTMDGDFVFYNKSYDTPKRFFDALNAAFVADSAGHKR